MKKAPARGLWYRSGMDWLYGLLDSPTARTVFVLSVVACAGEFIRSMRERDLKKLRRIREGRERRDGERTAAIAQRVGKLGGPSGSTQERISD